MAAWLATQTFTLRRPADGESAARRSWESPAISSRVSITSPATLPSTLAASSPNHAGTDVVGVLCAAGARKALNEVAEDFYLYSLKRFSLSPAEVQDNSFIQRAEFLAVVQF